MAALTNGQALALGAGIIGVVAIGAMLLHDSHENPVSRKRLCKTSSKIQTLIFSKKDWTKTEAKAWAKKHGYRYSKTDEKPDTIRIRQAPPGKFKRLRTISLGKGIKAVAGWERC